VVDEATRFQAGRFISDFSSKNTWDLLRMCWIDTYLGPPDWIVADAGKNFVSKEFGQIASTVGTKLKIVPVELHNLISITKRYHGPLRRAYQILEKELKGTHKDMLLQMALKALNDSVGPDGLVPTLLVFGAYPRMSKYDAPSPSIAERAAAIKKAMTEVKKLRSERLVQDAIHSRNGPSTLAIHDLPLNSLVLVTREIGIGHAKMWRGPHTLVGMDGENCYIDINGTITSFRSTSVKPFLESDDPLEGIQIDLLLVTDGSESDEGDDDGNYSEFEPDHEP
jgi:hypothetical protein